MCTKEETEDLGVFNVGFRAWVGNSEGMEDVLDPISSAFLSLEFNVYFVLFDDVYYFLVIPLIYVIYIT